MGTGLEPVAGEPGVYRSHALAALEAHVWRVAAIDRDPAVWWAAEVVQLASTWSPQCAVICIAFFIDPMAETIKPNPPEWVVGACSRRPETRRAAGEIATFSLGRLARAQHSEFLDALHAFRQVRQLRQRRRQRSNSIPCGRWPIRPRALEQSCQSPRPRSGCPTLSAIAHGSSVRSAVTNQSGSALP